MILECKITKVVERPGVHYRGRHSPWISGYLVGSFCFRRLLYEINTRTELMASAIYYYLHGVSIFAFFQKKNETLKMRTTLPRKHRRFHSIFSSSRRYHWLITFCFTIAFVFVENALSIANLQRMIFDSLVHYCSYIYLLLSIASDLRN